MTRLLLFYRSTIGKKAVAALTGFVMVGFLLAHATGNLKVFLPSPEPPLPDIDVYAEALRTLGEPIVPREGVLWALRVVLILSLLLHVDCVVQLARRSRAARPRGYQSQRLLQATLPARMMLVGGILLFAFVVFHVLHFTAGTIDPANFDHGAVYHNLYRAFTSWPLVALYVVAMAIVALHLYHGIWSAFQTLGVDSPDRNKALRAVAAIVSFGLFAGFVAVPTSFLMGVLPDPEAATSHALHLAPEEPSR